MKVKELAALAGISVRTLHHYDEIGLLKPDGATETGYREYSQENLEQLQQILFFRALEFPLQQIKEMMSDPSYDRQKAFLLHRQLLLEKRDRIDRMLATLEKTVRCARGEVTMSNEEKFEGFDFGHNPYEQEARERWGDEAVDRSNAKLASMDQAQLQEEMNALYRRLADVRHLPPASKEAQAVIGQWYALLQRMGAYSLEAFKGLGQMYVEDERFSRNINKFGEGLALFMCKAMSAYADERLAQSSGEAGR